MLNFFMMPYTLEKQSILCITVGIIFANQAFTGVINLKDLIRLIKGTRNGFY